MLLWKARGNTVSAPYDRIGDYLVTWMEEELAKRGVSVDPSASTRLLLTLDSYQARIAGMVFRGTSSVSVAGGTSLQKTIEIVNNSPGNIYRALSGTLARLTITVLNDPDVRAFLAAGR